ncbi:hypothetical protein ACIPEK_46460, partial [Streptomyces sp. NPDC088246]
GCGESRTSGSASGSGKRSRGNPGHRAPGRLSSFGWLVRNRRLARDYERLTATSEAMIKVAMIRLMLVRLAGQSLRWSHESHHKTARANTVEDYIAA